MFVFTLELIWQTKLTRLLFGACVWLAANNPPMVENYQFSAKLTRLSQNCKLQLLTANCNFIEPEIEKSNSRRQKLQERSLFACQTRQFICENQNFSHNTIQSCSDLRLLGVTSRERKSRALFSCVHQTNKARLDAKSEQSRFLAFAPLSTPHCIMSSADGARFLPAKFAGNKPRACVAELESIIQSKDGQKFVARNLFGICTIFQFYQLLRHLRAQLQSSTFCVCRLFGLGTCKSQFANF